MKIHLIGIGGIGVSALAKYYLEKGHKVSGSDLVASEITQALKDRGGKLFIGKHKAENIKVGIDLVIYSPAVKTSNLELKEAKRRKLKVQSYPQALGDLTKEYFTIAVSGTHGKSTTSAMLGQLLVKAGLDPTVIVGTKVKEFGDSNCRVGKSKYLVIEADEHFASFLNYRPKIIVLTNIEKDHLDFYKNLQNLLKTFKEYIGLLPKEGILVYNLDDENIKKILKGNKFKTKGYSFNLPEAKKLKKVLQIPGNHNVLNALSALVVARLLNVPDKVSFKALSEYKGSWRRLDEKKTKIKGKNITVISDYGHHPTEIKVTLEALKEKYSRKKIWCVYQPHQYQRTYYLFNDFVKVLRNIPIEKVILTDIFDVVGREGGALAKKVNSEKLAEKVNKNNLVYLPKKKILSYLRENISQFEIVVFMGAGDIYLLVDCFCLTKKGKKRRIR